jgi:sugar phosphate permease
VRGALSANASMIGNAATFATLFLRVFLPFAFAYFLSYIFRGVNAVIFPYLERDIGITAGDLAACRRCCWPWRRWVRPCLA